MKDLTTLKLVCGIEMDLTKNRVAALTGSIATGKSFVSNYFSREYGFSIVDADKIGHSVLERSDIAELIRVEFGKAIVADGIVDRKLLGRAVFSDRKKLNRLNEIVHPVLIKDSIALITRLSFETPVIFEAAVLFEAGWHKNFETVILTTCDPSIQLKRIISRDRISETEALARISAQMPFEEKSLLADHIIDTTDGIEAVTDTLDEIAEKLLKKHRS